MSLQTQHPSYLHYLLLWQKLRDFYDGQDTVKSKTTDYLPATPGMLLDGMGVGATGKACYDSYIARAVFPDYIRDAIEIGIGLLHQKEAVIELPPELEPLRNLASNKKESLLELLQRINEQQLITGRLGLLLDFPENPVSLDPLPYIALYHCENIINWDESNDSIDSDELNLVVLEESHYERTGGFGWAYVQQHRVLELSDDVYKQGVFVQSTEFDAELMKPPVYKGTTLSELPFVIVNSKDTLPRVDTPPLLGLANIVESIYRGEADYRWSLFMQGQDTLVIIGGVSVSPGTDDTLRTGAGSRIDVTNPDGDAKYIGVNSDGLSEQRLAVETDRKRAEIQSGRMIGDKANVESGKALSVRITAQTASLNQIALTSARALEKILKKAARWMGADDSLVKVIPNMEFADIDFQGQELVNIMNSRGLGAPISIQSIHAVLVDKGLTTLDFETEMKKILDENKRFEFLNQNKVVQPTNPTLPTGVNK